MLYSSTTFLSESRKRTANQADAVTEWRKSYYIASDIPSKQFLRHGVLRMFWVTIQFIRKTGITKHHNTSETRATSLDILFRQIQMN
jgi:hypothetical protein